MDQPGANGSASEVARVGGVLANEFLIQRAKGVGPSYLITHYYYLLGRSYSCIVYSYYYYAPYAHTVTLIP